MDMDDSEGLRGIQVEIKGRQVQKFGSLLSKIFLVLCICLAGSGSLTDAASYTGRGEPAGGALMVSPLTAKPAVKAAAVNAKAKPAVKAAAVNAKAKPAVKAAAVNAKAKPAVTAAVVNAKAKPAVTAAAVNAKAKPAVKAAAVNAKQWPVLDGNIKATPVPHDYAILVKKSEYKLYLLDKGQPVAVWGVALGKNAGQKTVSGDMKTPDGTFEIDEIDDASTWTHDFQDGQGEVQGAYGPWFLSLNTDSLSEGRWGGIGIHGTHNPKSIGTRASEGCIRLQNENLVKLKPVAKVGMKVTIEE